jgi:DNA-binding MarR family transcriptional regulator
VGAPAEVISLDLSVVTDLQAETRETAAALRGSLGLLYRRIRQIKTAADLTLPESSALSRLRHSGPMTAAQLAKLEQVTQQSIGATIASLTERGLIGRTADPGDGRRMILSLTPAGLSTVEAKRTARSEQLVAGLSDGFTAAELRTLAAAAPLLERLAQKL